MNKEQLQAQVVPGSVGGAISIIWMTYGEWMGIIPPDLNEVKYLALTTAVGVFATALVNVVQSFLPNLGTVSITQPDGTRRMNNEEHQS